MKNFLRAYNYTLVPVVGILIVLCSAYIHFTKQIPIDKAFKLGTLYGFFIGIATNVVAAWIVLWKLNHPSKQKTLRKTNTKSQNQRELTKVTPTRIRNTQINTFLKEMYLLVDKEMAFDISLDTIVENSFGTPTDTNKHRGTFSVRTKKQTIDFEVQPLTRHTSKLNIKAQKHNETFTSILSGIKAKEFSILSY